MDNTQSKIDTDFQSIDDAMRKIWGPTWGKYRNMNGKDDFQRKTAPDMNKGQASKELQSEIAALKKSLNDIFVSLQSANEKITKVSEALAKSSLWEDSKTNSNNTNSVNNQQPLESSSSSSGESSGSSDESSGESDGSSNDDSGSNNRKRRRRRSRQINRKNNGTVNSNKQSDARIQDLNKKIKDMEKQIQTLKERPHVVDLQGETSYEQQLQERKKNNLVVFGLQEDQRDDISQLRALFSNLGANVNVDNIQFFRTGRSLEKCRPLIVKLRNQEEKAEILFKAKRLKNNQNWQGVSITHDLTKQQCQKEKIVELELKRKAEEMNCQLLGNEKFEKFWKVVGGRGTRRLVLRNKGTPVEN